MRRSLYARKPETGRTLRRDSRARGLQCRRLRACRGRSANRPSEAHPIPQWQAQNLAHRACPDVPPRRGAVPALILNESPQDKEPGWGARDIEAAYNLPSSSKGSGQIVAIVDAYDNPNVASDLAVYRSHYGLPKAKFYKYNQDGQQSHYPKADADWGYEIDLDVDMVSASCPNCTIYLVEANRLPILRDIDTAETEAVKLGAHIVNNSFECSAVSAFDFKAFETPGVTYVAAAGDTPTLLRDANGNSQASSRWLALCSRKAVRSIVKSFGPTPAAAARRTSPNRRGNTIPAAPGGRPTTWRPSLGCRGVRQLRLRRLGHRRRHEHCHTDRRRRLCACGERRETRRRQNLLDVNG